MQPAYISHCGLTFYKSTTVLQDFLVPKKSRVETLSKADFSKILLFSLLQLCKTLNKYLGSDISMMIRVSSNKINLVQAHRILASRTITQKYAKHSANLKD